MALHIARILEDDDSGVVLAEPTSSGFIDGYAVADRLLEGVPIEIYRQNDGELAVRISEDPELLKQMHVNVKTVCQTVLEWVSSGAFDVLSSDKNLADDDVIIYDDTISLQNQAFSASPRFTLRA